jgi:hypothetical protein
VRKPTPNYKVPPPPRPKTGGGTPFCAGGGGGRWRAPDGWREKHTSWQPSASSEFGVAEKWPVVGSGTQESRSRIRSTQRSRAHTAVKATDRRGRASVGEFGRALHHGQGAVSPSRSREWAGASARRLQRSARVDEELYGRRGSAVQLKRLAAGNSVVISR